MAKITFSLHIDDGTGRKLEELTDKEREKLFENAQKRGSTALSLYYTQHPDEFLRLK